MIHHRRFFYNWHLRKIQIPGEGLFVCNHYFFIVFPQRKGIYLRFVTFLGGFSGQKPSVLYKDGTFSAPVSPPLYTHFFPSLPAKWNGPPKKGGPFPRKTVAKWFRSWYTNRNHYGEEEAQVKLLKKHVLWFWKRCARDRVDSSAAHGAFFLIISCLPFLAFLLTLMQMIHFSNGVSLIELALESLPPPVAQYLWGLLPSALESSGVMPVAVIAAVWSSSSGMVAIIKGLDQVYEVKTPRSFLRLRVVAALSVVVFALVLVAAAALLVFGTTIYNFLLSHASPFFAQLLLQFKSLAGFVLLFLFFALMYTFLPRRRVRLWYNLAGAAFTAGGWVLFSYLFSLFVENFSGFSIYGGLATLVMLMFWLFFCMYILFLGAEVAMWLEQSGIWEDLRLPHRKRPRHGK